MKERLRRLESARGGLPVTIRVNPHGDPAHVAEVRRIGALPTGYLICTTDDDLAALLGPNDPVTLRHRGPGITIRRSYGLDPA